MQAHLREKIKAFYDFVPFKKEIFSWLKKVWTPPETIYRHLHFKGVINIPIDQDHQFKMRHYGFQIENEIFWSGLNGGWEKQSANLWIKLCAESQVIFDIGANTGIYSLIAKSLRPNSAVYAFEPVKRVFQKLQANNELNGYDIHCYDLAVSDYDGEGMFFDSDTEHIYSVTINKKLVPSSTIETKVQTIKLDSFIEQNKISKIDLMKIDVESHEAEVLQGFKKYIEIYKPTFLIEILFEEVANNVQELIKDLDYLYFHIDEESGIKQTDQLKPFPHNWNYLLCTKEVAKKLRLLA